MRAPEPGRSRLVPAATLVLVILGTALLTTGATLALAGRDDGPPTSTTGAESTPTAAPTPTAEAWSGPVSAAVDPAWVRATATTVGVPEPALAAYAGASLVLATTHPECGLGWNALAALGEVGSRHGAEPATTQDGGSGPMRIATAVWSAHARDGDGDGVADIESLDDAALTIGHALCSGGLDLTQADSLAAALALQAMTAKDVRRTVRTATTYAAAG